VRGFRIWVGGTYFGWVEAVLQSWGATIECHVRTGSWGPNPENRAVGLGFRCINGNGGRG
jgi:hypothetical protein